MESIKNQEKFTLTEYEHDDYFMSANAEYGLINEKKVGQICFIEINCLVLR